ncbi:hypothetical protein PENTCL1PPCAC_15092, partial [Pristionchus entomophagus]
VILEARVTFPYSEVLQANDLVNNETPFVCDDGCTVFVDRVDDALHITQNGQFIANFKDIVGKNTYKPDGIELPAGKNYKLETRSMPTADFVFYAVSIKAPNYGVSVFAPQEKLGIAASFPDRYFTLLSRFNAIEYFGFNGTYPPEYPKIFTTGFDAVGYSHCEPVYRARSQYNAEQSRPVIFSPIITVDFGFVGPHVVIANQEDGNNRLTTSVASTVYMSPGYVGCSFTGSQYYSNVKSVQDTTLTNAN